MDLVKKKTLDVPSSLSSPPPLGLRLLAHWKMGKRWGFFKPWSCYGHVCASGQTLLVSSFSDGRLSPLYVSTLLLVLWADGEKQSYLTTGCTGGIEPPYNFNGWVPTQGQLSPILFNGGISSAFDSRISLTVGHLAATTSAPSLAVKSTSAASPSSTWPPLWSHPHLWRNIRMKSIANWMLSPKKKEEEEMMMKAWIALSGHLLNTTLMVSDLAKLDYLFPNELLESSHKGVPLMPVMPFCTLPIYYFISSGSDMDQATESMLHWCRLSWSQLFSVTSHISGSYHTLGNSAT